MLFILWPFPFRRLIQFIPPIRRKKLENMSLTPKNTGLFKPFVPSCDELTILEYTVRELSQKHVDQYVNMSVGSFYVIQGNITICSIGAECNELRFVRTGDTFSQPAFVVDSQHRLTALLNHRAPAEYKFNISVQILFRKDNRLLGPAERLDVGRVLNAMSSVTKKTSFVDDLKAIMM